jgi:RNA polymerase sigma-70 factor (ECF subfamily)
LVVDTLEITWLLQAKQGDNEAFTRLVEQYQTPVYNLCYRMLSSVEEAEDAAQETFWRAYRSLNKYDVQRSFITWLLSIAAHYCIDQYRRRKVPVVDMDMFAEETLPDPSPTPEKEAGRLEEQRFLHRLVAGLPAQDRAAVIMRYWYDFSDEEIARALSLTVSAVKSRLHRTRLRLAQMWQSSQPEIVDPERTEYESPAF